MTVVWLADTDKPNRSNPPRQKRRTLEIPRLKWNKSSVRKFLLCGRSLHFLLAGIAFGVTVLSTRAADLKLEARLIWGANDEKETVKYEPLDPALSDKLHRTFKWKNYYEITNRAAGIPINQISELKMSDSAPSASRTWVRRGWK